MKGIRKHSTRRPNLRCARMKVVELLTLTVCPEQEAIITEVTEMMRKDRFQLWNVPYFQTDDHPLKACFNAWRADTGEHIPQKDVLVPNAMIQYGRIHTILALSSRNPKTGESPLKYIQDGRHQVYRPMQLDHIEDRFRKAVSIMARFEQVAMAAAGRHRDLPTHLVELAQYFAGVKYTVKTDFHRAFIAAIHQYIANRGAEGELAMKFIERALGNPPAGFMFSCFDYRHCNTVLAEYAKE